MNLICNRYLVRVLVLSVFTLLCTALAATPSYALTCEEVCSVAKEGGMSEIEDESGDPVRCCCIDNGGTMESRPDSECAAE